MAAVFTEPKINNNNYIALHITATEISIVFALNHSRHTTAEDGNEKCTNKRKKKISFNLKCYQKCIYSSILMNIYQRVFFSFESQHWFFTLNIDLSNI